MRSLLPGVIHEAMVTQLEQYGAWVDCHGVKGLVKIPEISWSRLSHPGNRWPWGNECR